MYRDFDVTILPADYVNSPPYLKPDVSGKYTVYENQELVIKYVPEDLDAADKITTDLLIHKCQDQT